MAPAEEWDGQRKPGKEGLLCSTSCGTCVNANPDTDTVKVEIAQPPDDEGIQRIEEVESQWRACDKAEDFQREVESDVQWRAGEQARLLELEEQRRQQEATLRAEEEARAEAARLEEKARRAREEEQRLAEAEVARLAAERRQLIEVFLKDNKFTNGVNGAKKTCMKTKWPIHSAAKRGDSRVVSALVLEGADVSQKDSKGKTAMDIAEAKRFVGVVEVLKGAS